MEQIAAEAGVTKPILYRHIGGREAFVTALTDRFVDELTSHLRSVLDRPDAPPKELLEAGIDGYLDLIERETNLYRFLVWQVGGEPGAAVVLSQVVRQIAQMTTQVIGESLRGAGADSGAAEPWGYAIVGMVHATGDWWLEHRTMPRHRVVEYLVNLAWEGMRMPASGTEASSVSRPATER